MNLTDKELEKRFVYHHSTRPQSLTYQELALFYLAFSKVVNEHCPDSREKSLAITALEESMFWAIASISRNESKE